MREHEQSTLGTIETDIRRQMLEEKVRVALSEGKDYIMLGASRGGDTIGVTAREYWENISREHGVGIAILLTQGKAACSQEEAPEAIRTNIFFLSKEKLEDAPQAIGDRFSFGWFSWNFRGCILYNGANWHAISNTNPYSYYSSSVPRLVIDDGRQGYLFAPRFQS